MWRTVYGHAEEAVVFVYGFEAAAEGDYAFEGGDVDAYVGDVAGYELSD